VSPLRDSKIRVRTSVAMYGAIVHGLVAVKCEGRPALTLEHTEAGGMFKITDGGWSFVGRHDEVEAKLEEILRKEAEI
jgi:hypothetical protein